MSKGCTFGSVLTPESRALTALCPKKAGTTMAYARSQVAQDVAKCNLEGPTEIRGALENTGKFPNLSFAYDA
jgi:hypothetical protein